MLRQSRDLVVGLAALLALAACGGTVSSPPSEVPSAASVAPTPSATPTSTGPQRLSGVVQAGVEANCLLLSGALEGGGDGSTHVWLLLGATGEISPGDQVTVEGQPSPGTMTTCQQGEPFTVSRVL